MILITLLALEKADRQDLRIAIRGLKITRNSSYFSDNKIPNWVRMQLAIVKKVLHEIKYHSNEEVIEVNIKKLRQTFED